MKAKFLIGIDEAGRGPLAGPVSVGVFAVRDPEILKTFVGARDSKKMSERQRETVFLLIEKAFEKGDIHYSVSFSSANVIDQKGIVHAVRAAMDESLKKIERKFIQDVILDSCEILLDGSLKAPDRYKNQKTIIRGDDSEPVISLASICAKVLRDRHMKELALKHPNYGFEVHKGYGTKKHYEAIKKYGLSKEHRRTFVRVK